MSMALNFLTQRVTPVPVPDSACALLNSSRHSQLSQVSKRSGSLRPRFGPVSFSGSCQRQWRRAAPTAVGSTYELALRGAAESKRLTFKVKSSLFSDGESLCAAMLPSSDPPSTARRTRWRQSFIGSWVVEREASPPLFCFFLPLLTLWQGSNDNTLWNKHAGYYLQGKKYPL